MDGVVWTRKEPRYIYMELQIGVAITQNFGINFFTFLNSWLMTAQSVKIKKLDNARSSSSSSSASSSPSSSSQDCSYLVTILGGKMSATAPPKTLLFLVIIIIIVIVIAIVIVIIIIYIPDSRFSSIDNLCDELNWTAQPQDVWESPISAQC